MHARRKEANILPWMNGLQNTNKLREKKRGIRCSVHERRLVGIGSGYVWREITAQGCQALQV